jgi:transcriptional regulator with GAF, ATPase, and Fis domain
MRSRNDFFDIVIAQLRKIFTFDGFAITYIHEDGKTFGVFNVDKRYDVQNIPGYQNVLSARVPVTDPHYNIIIHSEEPVLFTVDEMVADENIISMAAFSKISGIKQFLSVPLRVGGNTIGAASFHSFGDLKIEANNSLLKSICAQIAVAVSNIMAHEKILNQLDEINKYKQQLEDEKIYLKEEIESSHNYAEIIGESAEIKKVFRLVTQVAYSDSTVLILGETGTGKELIARAIHNSSTRKNKLMVKVNCAALPASLIESELFGHERGSFTGAIERRIGKFELANNGTLFLDEIGEMTPELQVKLLRALQEKEIERVGGKTTIKTDVRIIAATNRDLEKLMEEGKFRSDLYYRLNIFPISLPPLRDRREDIPQIASYFIVRYAKKSGKKINTIGSKALQELIHYDWPGNIRELEHLIERSVLLATGDTIKEIHLPHQKRNVTSDASKKDISIRTIDENEKDHILKILKHVKGKIGGAGGAAELLGVPTSTLNSRIKRLGIRKEHL